MSYSIETADGSRIDVGDDNVALVDRKVHSEVEAVGVFAFDSITVEVNQCVSYTHNGVETLLADLGPVVNMLRILR